MQHITNVLVHSNRCEVVDGHIFATGDKGLPHIHLKFLYMFGESSLQGKNLECKYLLPNGKYSAETVRITRKDEVTFPIHYSCFTVNGWTTLRITLVNGSNRVTLEDIIIKTKETKLGDKYSNIEIENAITSVISVTTDSIRKEGEHVKQEVKKEIDNYIKENKNKLKGDQGPRGLQGLQGLTGKQGNTGETGPRGKSLNFKWQGDKLAVQVEGEEFQLSESLKGPKGATGERGERGPMGERGPQGMQGPRGMTGERGLTGQKGDRGTGITSISALDNNRVQMEYGDGQSIVVNIPTIEGKQGEKGKNGNSLEFNWNGTQLGVRQSGMYSYAYKDLRGPQGTKGEIGPKGERGVGVTSVTPLNNNQVRLEYGDGQSAVVEIPTVAGQQGQKGEDGKGLEFTWKGTELGVRKEGDSSYSYKDLKGPKGDKGEPGNSNSVDTSNLAKLDESTTFQRNLTVKGDILSQGNVTAYSDIRLKKNVKNIENPLEKLREIRGVTFEWKKNGKKTAGVIAQEVEKILPQAVQNQGYKSVDYNALVGLCIEINKALLERIERLEKVVEKYGNS